VGAWRDTVLFIGDLAFVIGQQLLDKFDRRVFEHRKCLLRLIGFVSQNEAIGFKEETDDLPRLWAYLSSIPRTLFEYPPIGKTFLALCHPDSDIDRILRETGYVNSNRRRSYGPSQALYRSTAVRSWTVDASGVS